MPGFQRVRETAKRFAPQALILVYHRVSAKSLDPQLLCVTPEHFAEHMQVLRQKYHPLSLKSLRQRPGFNLWRPRSVVVTFDDGYADNFHHARTILEAHETPATIFVTSGNVDTGREFWWDELERIFLFTPSLPARLEIMIAGKGFLRDLENPGSPDFSASWDVLSDISPTPRQQLYLELMGLLRPLDAGTMKPVLAELAAWAGLDGNRGRLDHQAVNAEQLRSLPKAGLIDIGAHTVNHACLSALPLDAQNAEIVGSKAALESMLDRPVSSFAYPFGERRDYTRDTVRLVREAGFTCACANFAGRVTALSDPYQLPRLIVRDLDGDAFARRMGEWFYG
jgi:peptidoglycan/xylan/chitin deacetylase (PgdA/CDA1 family)